MRFWPRRPHADIYRWDTGEVIPGTEGIEPGPGLDLSSQIHWEPEVGLVSDGPWNTGGHNLRYADFSNGVDLTGATFRRSWLDYSDFSGANLTNVDLGGAIVTGTTWPGRL